MLANRRLCGRNAAGYRDAAIFPSRSEYVTCAAAINTGVHGLISVDNSGGVAAIGVRVSVPA
ncbi:MAG TPA: hypothetical protein DEB57_13425, partial [Microbacterium sp.]|nr:hypothetical protein [Microbacterium sp.]